MCRSMQQEYVIALRLISKWVIRLCLALFAAVGVLVLAYCCFGYYYTAFVPKSLPVPLGNGFVYADGPNPDIEEKVLYNEHGQVIVRGDIEEMIIYRTTVYGWRYEHPFERRYFICAYGDDCTDSQDYTDTAFESARQARGLPPFAGLRLRNQPLLQTKEWVKIRLHR